MVEGNSLRDTVKDTIRACLSANGVEQGKADEITYDLADNIFDVLGISDEYQDNTYEEELTELMGFYEARGPVPSFT